MGETIPPRFGSGPGMVRPEPLEPERITHEVDKVDRQADGSWGMTYNFIDYWFQEGGLGIGVRAYQDERGVAIIQGGSEGEPINRPLDLEADRAELLQVIGWLMQREFDKIDVFHEGRRRRLKLPQLQLEEG